MSLQARLRQLGAPDGFLNRLVGEILEASVDPNEKNRIRSRRILRPYFLRLPSAFGGVMGWITESYEHAAREAGTAPDRDLLYEIELILERGGGE